MPLIYRAMMIEDGMPMVGDTRDKLGVRPDTDVEVDSVSNVAPGTGGMSVAPQWRELPPFLIPKRLKHLVPEARGRNTSFCWRMGEGPFSPAAVTDRLDLRTEGQTHGLVEPSQPMSLVEYQDALASTRDAWTIDEN